MVVVVVVRMQRFAEYEFTLGLKTTVGVLPVAH